LFFRDFQTRIDHHIDFFWSDEASIPNVISPTNFSVRWKGFIKVPKAGRYKFHLNTDGGGILNINGSVVIKNELENKPFYDWLMFDLRKLNKSIKENQY